MKLSGVARKQEETIDPTGAYLYNAIATGGTLLEVVETKRATTMEPHRLFNLRIHYPLTDRGCTSDHVPPPFFVFQTFADQPSPSATAHPISGVTKST